MSETTIIQSNETLGQLWAGEYNAHTSDGTKKFDPATIALLVQLAAVLIPRLMERCNKSAVTLRTDAIHGLSSLEERVAKREIRKELGWWKYFYYGPQNLLDSAVLTLRKPEAQPCCEAYDTEV